VEKAIREYLGKIKSDPQILVIKEEYAEPIEDKKLWSTFCEAELLVLGLEKLSWLAIEFTPASLEIIEPDLLTYKNKDLTHWTNDLLAKLHEIGTVTKALNQKNKILEMNTSVIVRNCILALLEKERTEKDLGAMLGLEKENILQFLNALEGEGRIVKKGNLYHRILKKK
jgi:predicted transcriptional regulator